MRDFGAASVSGVSTCICDDGNEDCADDDVKADDYFITGS